MVRLRLAVVILLPLAASACDQAARDAESVWRPKGINAANLAVMVDDPADLAQGRHDPGPDRKLSADAVQTLWANPVAPLASQAAVAGSGSGSSGSGSSGSGSSGSGSSGGGSGN